MTQSRTNVTARSRPPLYALIEEHFPRFLERLEAEGVSLLRCVKEEFEAYLKCGRLIRRAGLRVGARTGAVTLIQRFGSALNLNIHRYMLYDPLTFRRARKLSASSSVNRESGSRRSTTSSFSIRFMR